jgi:hypothetical protein
MVGGAFIGAARFQRVEIFPFLVQHQLSHRFRRR